MARPVVNFANYISPVFDDVIEDMMAFRHDQYFLGGGRGSFKSTTTSARVDMGILDDPDANAVVYRKVKDTIAGTVFARYCKTIRDNRLERYFKIHNSPQRITFRNRHGLRQEIRFLGLDKADKSKSAEFEHGYCKFVHFEELDQYNGWKEVHDVIETMGRGGPYFQFIGTYNPPESLTSWVNVEARMPKENRLVHLSNYTMHPRELQERWLGLPFLREAESVRLTQPERYRHIYLGEQTGTGGEVFRNVTVRRITQEERDGFKVRRYGMDFGFTNDPTALSMCAYDRKYRRLYIYGAYGGCGMFEEQIMELLRSHGLEGEYVTCDSAEQRVIAKLRYLGARGAKPCYKKADFPRFGLNWLRGLVEIVIDPEDAAPAAEEFTHYEFDRFRDGTLRNDFPDRDNHWIDATRYAMEDEIRFAERPRIF